MYEILFEDSGRNGFVFSLPGTNEIVAEATIDSGVYRSEPLALEVGFASEEEVLAVKATQRRASLIEADVSSGAWPTHAIDLEKRLMGGNLDFTLKWSRVISRMFAEKDEVDRATARTELATLRSQADEVTREFIDLRLARRYLAAKRFDEARVAIESLSGASRLKESLRREIDFQAKNGSAKPQARN